MTHPGLKGSTFHPYLSPLTYDSATFHPKYTSFSQKPLKNNLGLFIEDLESRVSSINLHKIMNQGMRSVHSWNTFIHEAQESLFKV